MKKILFLALGFSLVLSACLPTFLQPAASPAPEVDLAGTADVLVQQTLQAQPQPSPTLAPSNTPVVVNPTQTQVPPTPTETQNSFLLTLTATLGTGTVSSAPGPSGTPTVTVTGTLPTSTPTIAAGAAPTETLHPRFYGTLPPSLPSGTVTLINKSKTEAYISLQCTTSDGNVTIIEYPVSGGFDVKAPSGKYIYVAWVGGNKMSGGFGLGTGDQVTIKLYKDKVVVSNK
jgi:hypothetical protein